MPSERNEKASFSRVPSLFLVLGASAVTSLGLLVASLWLFSLIGYAWFLLILARHTPSFTKALWYSALFGFVTSGAGVWWFWHTLPLSWLGIPSGFSEWYLVGVTWFVTVCSLLIPIALLSPLFFFSRNSLFFILLGVVLIPLQEYMRMWSFAVVFFAPASAFGPHFSIASFGYALAESPTLLQIAQWGGLHTLNAAFGLLVSLGATLFLFLKEQHVTYLKHATLIGACCLFIGAVFLVASPYTEPAQTGSLRTSLLSMNVHGGEPFSIRNYLDLFAEAAKDNPEVIVTPEGYAPMRFIPNEKERALWYARTFPGRDVLVIGSLPPESEGEGLGRLVYESSQHGILETHNKVFLVPVGEYLPPVLHPLFLIGGNQGTGELIDDLYGTGVHGTDLEAITFKGVRIGALMCSEILSPSLFHKLHEKEGAQVLINISNNFWFHGSKLLYAQLLKVAKVHAVRNRAYVLVSGNTSPSFVFSPNGTLLAETVWNADALLTVDVPSPMRE